MKNYKDILKRDLYFLDFESNKAGDLFLLGLEHDKKYTCALLLISFNQSSEHKK